MLHGLRVEDREQPEQDGSPGVCQIDPRCGSDGRQGNETRVRKAGKTYFRECKACGTSEVIWTEA